MDDTFSDQENSIVSLANELKNVNISLDDIQKTLDKKKVEFKPRTVETNKLPTPVKAPAKESSNTVEPKLTTVDESVKAVETLEQDLLQQQEDMFNKLLQTTNTEQSIASKPATTEATITDLTDKPAQTSPTVPAPIIQNNITIQAAEQETTPPVKAAKDVQQKVVNDTKKPVSATQVEPISKLPQKQNNNIVERTENQAKPVTIVKEPQLQPNQVLAENEQKISKIQEPEIEQLNIQKDAPVQIEQPKINQVVVERDAQQSQAKNVSKPAEPAKIENEMVEATKTTPEKPKVEPQRKLDIQEETPSRISQKPLQIINENEKTITPSSTKDTSLVNMERSVTLLTTSINKSMGQMLEQLGALNNIATEILRTIPMANAQKQQPMAGSYPGGQGNIKNPGGIKDFRNMTSQLFAPSKLDNRPTLI